MGRCRSAYHDRGGSVLGPAKKLREGIDRPPICDRGEDEQALFNDLAQGRPKISGALRSLLLTQGRNLSPPSGDSAGAKVTVLQRSERILSRFDADLIVANGKLRDSLLSSLGLPVPQQKFPFLPIREFRRKSVGF
jgi:hypothetical protein